MKRIGYASPQLPLALAAGALLAGAAPARAADTRAARGCEVSDLAAVFRDPASFAGRKFCGEALGIPDRAGIGFYPPGYDRASNRYDVAMFLSDRRASDRLRLSQRARSACTWKGGSASWNNAFPPRPRKGGATARRSGARSGSMCRGSAAPRPSAAE
ncbi:MAG: hypothetical protein QOD42_37 [Sphingomonadales bacterium]|jgi:hypothetical protein|nr:hypothetical protein [Sphingomonadales bacterium]